MLKIDNCALTKYRVYVKIQTYNIWFFGTDGLSGIDHMESKNCFRVSPDIADRLGSLVPYIRNQCAFFIFKEVIQ